MKNLVQGRVVVSVYVHGAGRSVAQEFCRGEHFERGSEKVHGHGEVASVEGGAVEETETAHGLRVCSYVSEYAEVESWKDLTLGVKLKHLEVHVGVGDYDVKLLLEGEEFGSEDFEVILAASEEHHLIWFFLWNCQNIC
jgi:hypothetical protein